MEILAGTDTSGDQEVSQALSLRVKNQRALEEKPFAQHEPRTPKAHGFRLRGSTAWWAQDLSHHELEPQLCHAATPSLWKVGVLTREAASSREHLGNQQASVSGLSALRDMRRLEPPRPGAPGCQLPSSPVIRLELKEAGISPSQALAEPPHGDSRTRAPGSGLAAVAAERARRGAWRRHPRRGPDARSSWHGPSHGRRVAAAAAGSAGAVVMPGNRAPGSQRASARPGDIVLKAPTQVHGFLGDSVTLPCHLQLPSTEVTHVSQLTWTRLGDSRSVAVFHRTQGPNYPESKRLEFVAARLGAELRDASLRVFELRAEDEGNYTCLFVTFPQGSRSAVTWLRVFAKPQNTAEAQKVQLTREPVPVARCISTGGRPPARITWHSDLGGMANMTQVQGRLSGTVTVTSLWILAPSSQVDGKIVTCKVEHESFEKPQLLAVNLTVYYPPEVSISGYDGNWYLGQTDANLTCDAHSNPEPTGYEWSTTMGPLPPSAVAQGAQLLIHPVDKSINTTFICNVTSALGARQAELTVQVKEGPPSEPPGMSWNNILLLFLGLLVVLTLLGFGLYFCWSRCSRRTAASTLVNRPVSYAPVANSSQDPQAEGTR
nr:poliovirus receptor [Aotus nancymaae]